MYSAPYGYQGSNNPGQFIPNPNPNAHPSPDHASHPHPHQLQQHQPGSQHMMFNAQQQAQYAGAQYAQGQGGIPGAMGMMQQNNGMAVGPHASLYQTPYSSSGYAGNMSTSTTPGLPPNFMPTTSGAPPYQMSASNILSNMNSRLQSQRMQPPSTSSTPGPRAPPFAGGAPQHNTPPHSTPAAQQQFSTPQPINQTQQAQTPSNAQPGMILTPQTPNFPPGAQGMMATPLSPGSEVREKERVTVLLEINKYLLMEVMRLQAVQAEAKKEDAIAGKEPETEKEKADREKERMEKAKKDYFECMKRLQSNLAYLAAIADRSHKPSSQIPPHPAIMSAPPLSPRPLKAESKANSPQTNSPEPKKEDAEEIYKPEGLDDDHGESLKEQYGKLQALFPGVDYKKMEQRKAVGPAQGAVNIGGQAGGQVGGQAAGAGGTDYNAQQKLQNDLLRQKMIQAQQQQQMLAQAQQARDPQGRKLTESMWSGKRP